MKKIRERIKYWLQLLLLPIYGLSFFTPRDKHIWLFGSTFGRRFADNARYLYLYVSQHRDDAMADQYGRTNVRPIWISRKKEIVQFLTQEGYEAYYVRSMRGIYYCLRSKVYIYDNYTKDICFWLSGGAVHVNLWHGSGNKKSNYDNKFDYLRHPRSMGERIRNFPISISNEKPVDYIVATSPMMAEIFISAFRSSQEHIIEAGYPRNDVLLGNRICNIFTDEERRTVEAIEAYKGRGYRIAVYMPTFRASEKLFFDVMDLKEFNSFLMQEKILFLTKMHPKSKVIGLFEEVSYPNIININAQVDPYVFLGQADLLVTDYSSIYSDYLLLDRPSVLFPYDYEEYSRDTRECYFPYDEYMPEIKAYTMQELMDAMRQVLERDDAREARRRLRDRIFSSHVDDASVTICTAIARILEDR